MQIATRLVLSLFVALVVMSCRDDDANKSDSQENHFTVGNDTRRIVLAARIGEAIQLENPDGTLFYRQQIRFWDEGYTYADNVVTGGGHVLTLWLNMSIPEVQPNNYIVQGKFNGSWGQIASGTWTVPTPDGEEPFQQYSILEGSYMKLLSRDDTYSFSFDLKVPTKQLPASFKGFYQGPLEFIPE